MIDASKFDANLQALVTAISVDVNGLINDSTPSTTSTYSATQIDAKVASVGEVVNQGVTALQTAITATQANLATLTSQVGEISSNAGGLVDTDFVALYKSLRKIA